MRQDLDSERSESRITPSTVAYGEVLIGEKLGAGACDEDIL